MRGSLLTPLSAPMEPLNLLQVVEILLPSTSPAPEWQGMGRGQRTEVKGWEDAGEGGEHCLWN